MTTPAPTPLTALYILVEDNNSSMALDPKQFLEKD
jgi:hypothetical protein